MTKLSEEYFFHLGCEKESKHCNDSIFSGCFHRAIIWFSLFIGLFQRAKTYLTRKMRLNARQSDNNVFYMLVVYLD